MKKIVSLLLLVSMLTSCCLFLGSCDRAREKDFEKDATAAIGTAFSNALSAFFTDDADIGKTVRKALENGKLEISFDGGDFADDVSLNETIYFSEDKQYAFETELKADGEKLSADIFVDQNGIILSSKDIFDSSKGLLLDPSTLGNALTDGYLGELLGISDAEGGMMVDILIQSTDYFAEQYELAFSDDEEAKHAVTNEILSLLEPELRTEKIKINGENTKCVIATYTIDNGTVAELVKYLCSVLPVVVASSSGMTEKEFVNSLIEEINSAIVIDATLEVAVAKRSNSLAKIELSGSVQLADSNDEYGFDLLGTFSETEIALNLEIDGDESFEAEAVLTKEESKDAVEYTLEVNAGYELISVVYTIEDSGDFSIEADIYGGDEIKLEGSVESEKKVATINLDTIKLDGDKYDLGLSFTFYREAELPSAPSAKDIAKMNEADWESLLEGMQNGILGDLFQ